MDYKDLLTIILSSSVISTCVTTFLSPVLEFIKSKCEQNKINNERRYNEEKEEKQKLKEVYLNVISIIQLIKMGFNDPTYRQINNRPGNFSYKKEKVNELNKKVQKINNLIETSAPLIRLYANDEISELFSQLAKYSKFSYSNNIISQFQLYYFDRKFSYMCKIMQKDLGLRIDNINLPEPHICPYCGYMHNSEEDCPSCSISWVDAIDIEDKFNESCKDDENLQRLVNMCANKGRGSLEFITYPINKDKWIDNMKEFLNTSN
jgi:Rubrerythrin